MPTFLEQTLGRSIALPGQTGIQGKKPGLLSQITSFGSSAFKSEPDSKTQLQNLGINTSEIENEVDKQATESKIKFLNKTQVSDIIKNAPEGTDPEGLINEMVNRGYTIEGLNDTPEGAESLKIDNNKPVIKDIEEEELGLGERISETGDKFKIEGSEEFGGVQTAKDLASTALNFPGDTVEGIGEFIDLVLNPLDTLTSFKDLGTGLSDKLVFNALNKMTGQDVNLPEKSEAITQAIGQQLEENFGTPGRAKKTIVENPVDTLLFVKGILSTVSKITKSSKLASISNKIDPIKLQTEPVKKIVKGTVNIGEETLGKVTGLGKEGVEDIIKLGKTEEFGTAFKGKIKPTEVVDDVTEAIKGLGESARKEFGLEEAKILKTSTKKINNTDILNKFNKKLTEDFGITIDKNKLISTANTSVSNDNVAKLQEAFDFIRKNKGDKTPIQTRNIMRRISDEISDAPELRSSKSALVELKKDLGFVIEEAVPGFKEMNTKFSTSLKEIKNLEDTFGGPKVKIETKINKLNQVLRDNQDYKKFMLSVIEESTGKNIKGKLAGIAARQILPRGLIGQIGAGGAAAALASGASIIPIILTLGIASPRLLGIISRSLGLTIDKLKSFVNLATKNLPEGVKGLPVTETIRSGVKGAGTAGPILDNTNK